MRCPICRRCIARQRGLSVGDEAEEEEGEEEGEQYPARRFRVSTSTYGKISLHRVFLRACSSPSLWQACVDP